MISGTELRNFIFQPLELFACPCCTLYVRPVRQCILSNKQFFLTTGLLEYRFEIVMSLLNTHFVYPSDVVLMSSSLLFDLKPLSLLHFTLNTLWSNSMLALDLPCLSRHLLSISQNTSVLLFSQTTLLSPWGSQGFPNTGFTIVHNFFFHSFAGLLVLENHSLPFCCCCSVLNFLKLEWI